MSERLRIKLLKNPPKPIQTISAREVRMLMGFRPTGRIQSRTWTLAVLLLDCGLRIDEALGLERANVDLTEREPRCALAAGAWQRQS